MLSIYEYIVLGKNERAELLWSKGEFITSIIGKDCSTSLYTLFGFYVEILIIEHDLTEIIPFKQGERLEKYLPDIDITDLEN